ncbi:hypothetical protein OHT76_42755 [Streptomyces sp. NBC_00287]|uniref:hypothetical protein n=1 Tax=Streptomyces sp. NBC_00287 TaxID=2975702 RepID=UPI002E293118|nr:hypothetical protein [Streptomyces sp. NBC_00287]
MNLVSDARWAWIEPVFTAWRARRTGPDTAAAWVHDLREIPSATSPTPSSTCQYPDRELVPQPLVHERVYGYEFTADCLVDRTGRASVILGRRNLVKAGLAAVSTTFDHATMSPTRWARATRCSTTAPC